MTVKKLPDAEFEVMRAVWQMEEPVTTAALTVQLRMTNFENDWKPQTILTMLSRLEKKGFLRSEKHSREREYYVTVPQEAYMQLEAENLRSRFSGGAFTGLVKALCDTDDLSADDIDDLRNWLNKRRNR